MSENRPTLPRPLKRDLLFEAGYRCAIPTCKGTSALEFAHIVPRSTVKEDRFENMIVLCAVCHSRYDNTKEIDRTAMLRFKAKLSAINARYGDIERRVLQYFADNPGVTQILLTGNHHFDVMMLVRDGLLVMGKTFGTGVDPSSGAMFIQLPMAFKQKPGAPSLPKVEVDPRTTYDKAYYHLSDSGAAFVRRWVESEEPLPDLPDDVAEVDGYS